MSTRKIKDAKDLSTHELIYFKGHAKATYMSNGSTVEDTINSIRVGAGGGIESETDPVFTASPAASITNEKIDEWNDKVDKSTLAEVATSGSYDDLINKPTIPSAVTESTVSGWGFTKNTGTITQIKANGTDIASSGTADIPAASTSAYGVTKLSNSTSSTSTTLAATANSVKSAYDLANGKAAKITVSNQTATSKSISPNILYVWGTMSSLSITLATPADSTIYNEYMFQFTSGSTATTLSLPSTVKIAGDVTIESNKTYLVSILNNVAIIIGV